MLCIKGFLIVLFLLCSFQTWAGQKEGHAPNKSVILYVSYNFHDWPRDGWTEVTEAELDAAEKAYHTVGPSTEYLKLASRLEGLVSRNILKVHWSPYREVFRRLGFSEPYVLKAFPLDDTVIVEGPAEVVDEIEHFAKNELKILQPFMKVGEWEGYDRAVARFKKLHLESLGTDDPKAIEKLVEEREKAKEGDSTEIICNTVMSSGNRRN